MTVKCGMCPKSCEMEEGESGNCRVRRNIKGKLVCVVYGYACAANVDPVEKKPLFHFLPGTKTFSIATVGCNLHCLNCQNWEISQANPEDVPSVWLPPEKVVENAQKENCPSISYTYTDPVVYYEYARDCSKIAHEKKIKNILVTAAYINPEPWKKILELTDAANIDLKFIDDNLYRKICSAALKPVQEALIAAVQAKVHIEVTNLVIPTLNDKPDDLRKLSKWVHDMLGPEIPLHFSAFYPKYKMRNLPPTSPETLENARKIALDVGLKHVYVGNVFSKDGQTTFCPACGKALVKRSGFSVLQNDIKDGKCPCGRQIYGIWK